MTEEQAKQIKGMKLPLTPELGMFIEQLKADQQDDRWPDGTNTLRAKVREEVAR